MTVALEEFTEWRDSVEFRLGRLESVSDQHTEKFNHAEDLLGSIDEDLSKLQVEFRAQRKMLQALHLTQSDHTKMLGKHSEMLQEHGRALRELQTGQAKVLAGVQTMLGLLQSAGGSDS
jgi:chromosome segregation ATPase